VLEHDFGVSQYKVHWYMERTEELSHGGATGFPAAARHLVPAHPTDKSLASMLLAGELDAAAVVGPVDARRRASSTARGASPAAATGAASSCLFPDKIAETRRFFHTHGFLPANHTYIVRGSVYRQNPWVAINLFNGFVKAKALAAEKMLDRIPSGLFFGKEYAAMTREVVGDDPFAYGVKANRKMLTTLVDYSHEQGVDQGQAEDRGIVRGEHAGSVSLRVLRQAQHERNLVPITH
jgi:4,5-dihydroxyphthalate decarboxylase